MIDCPESLYSGGDLIVSLSVYIRGLAFQSPIVPSEDIPKAIFNEGHETLGEQALRERKSSLLRLFDAVGLKPQSGNDFSKGRNGGDVELKEENMRRMNKQNFERSSKSIKTEIVGDGEVVEVEDDGVDLSESELTMIYKRLVDCFLVRSSEY
jgi:DNA repair protein RAD5